MALVLCQLLEFWCKTLCYLQIHIASLSMLMHLIVFSCVIALATKSNSNEHHCLFLNFGKKLTNSPLRCCLEELRTEWNLTLWPYWQRCDLIQTPYNVKLGDVLEYPDPVKVWISNKVIIYLSYALYTRWLELCFVNSNS